MEIQVYNNGATHIFNEETLLAHLQEHDKIKKQLELNRDETISLIRQRNDILNKAYNFFNEQYSSGDSELTFTVEEINNFLEDIGADTLKVEYTATVNLTVTITGVYANSDMEADEHIRENISIDYSGEGYARLEEVEVTDLTIE